ncbi:hypothetical protein [Pseudomonas veronii]|nr:hypothetical protein [Pseudomonas veronii]
MSDSISECAEQHQEGEEGEDREGAAPDESAPVPLVGCHGEHIGKAL